jgi:glucose/arabinose dehydrogenase
LLAVSFASGQTDRQGTVAQRYQQLCANCHGANLEGGQAQSLLDDVWVAGGDDESIARSIRQGFPDKGMPTWGDAIPEKEIRAMVIYIRELRAKHQRGQITFAKPADSMAVTSKLHEYRLDTWVGKLEQPYSLAFISPERAIVTEKRGRAYLIENGKIADHAIAGIPTVDTAGQAGLFDVVPHPNYASNGWLYFVYSDLQEGTSMTKVIRGKLRNSDLVEQETIFQAAPEHYIKAGGVHFGGRIVFDGKGYIYFTIGDRGQKDHAQDLGRPTGKVHRLFDDGRLPPDNPFVNDPTALKSIWSYGHRNPQGLAIDPRTGNLYDVEHGPRGGDELNFVEKGKNYGWPVISYGINYDGTTMTELTHKEGMEQPVTYWTPSLAVCGLNFYSGNLFPNWKNHLFVATLAAQELRRIEIKVNQVVTQEVLFKNLGRIRHVVGGPDGALYVLLPERIARLAPAK